MRVCLSDLSSGRDISAEEEEELLGATERPVAMDLFRLLCLSSDDGLVAASLVTPKYAEMAHVLY